MEQTVETIQEENQKLWARIRSLEQEKEHIKEAIFKNNWKIYNLCEHDWCRDNTVSWDQCEYICKKCFLQKHMFERIMR